MQGAIAPAMKLEGDRTFWGRNTQDDLSDKAKQMLGVDLTLSTEGRNSDETYRRRLAKGIIDDPTRGETNARQTMLLYKGSHGSGINPTFPTCQDITDSMSGHHEDFYADVFGTEATPLPPSGGQPLEVKGGCL